MAPFPNRHESYVSYMNHIVNMNRIVHMAHMIPKLVAPNHPSRNKGSAELRLAHRQNEYRRVFCRQGNKYAV